MQSCSPLPRRGAGGNLKLRQAPILAVKSWVIGNFDDAVMFYLMNLEPGFYTIVVCFFSGEIIRLRRMEIAW